VVVDHERLIGGEVDHEVDHEELVSTAVGIALDAARNGHRPFGALVALGGEILASGVDTSRSSGDPTDHAEICAIRAAVAAGHSELDGCAVYASCEPCMMCTGAILRSGISSIYFAVTRELAATYGYPDVVTAEGLRAAIPPAVSIRCLPGERALAPFHAAEDRTKRPGPGGGAPSAT
jgi:tRNA(Arg) A34 adenosine deaminase TadA